MKILQLIYSLASGGAERFVVDLSNEMAAQGHEVYLCVLRDDSVKGQGFYKKAIASNVNYINLKLIAGFRLNNIITIGKLISKIKPDVVHCHQNLVNYVFPLTLFNLKVKFFYTVHDEACKEVGNKFEYLIRSFFFGLNKMNVITISRQTSNSFKNYYKIDAYTEIFNGRLKPKPSIELNNVTDYINHLKKTYRFVFVHIARCAEQKNQKMLVRVLNNLNQGNFSIALLVIGNGYDSPLGLELRAMSDNNIYFIGEKENIADYLMVSDAFCLSSYHEGMPITLIEAMACGCVPICTPVGGIVDTIEQGRTGFMSASLSDEDYSSAIKEYLENPDAINKNDLIELYNRRFSIAECTEKHIRLYSAKSL